MSEELTPFNKALDLVLKNVPLIPRERVKVGQASYRVLRKPVKADRPLPPFNRCAMDGWAVRCADLKGGRGELRTAGVLEAGREWKGRLEKGTAIKVMTGAPLPEGADAVIKVEQSEAEEGMVTLKEPALEKWLNVHKKGSDTRSGKTLIAEGELLTPSRAAVAASVGEARPEVTRKIKVRILTTGNEVIPADKNPKPWQIRDANSAQLLGSLSAMPMVDCKFSGLLKDSPSVFKTRISAALKDADILIVTGGVSMGDTDHTYRAFRELRVRKVFHKSAIRPGKPIWFGVKGRAAVFGLPGNPVSVRATFHEFVLPALRKMAGMKDPHNTVMHLPLSDDVRKKHNLREFRVARLTDGGKSVAPVPTYKGSGDFVSASQADGVIVIPEEEKRILIGGTVEFHPW